MPLSPRTRTTLESLARLSTLSPPSVPGFVPLSLQSQVLYDANIRIFFTHGVCRPFTLGTGLFCADSESDEVWLGMRLENLDERRSRVRRFRLMHLRTTATGLGSTDL